LKKKIEVCERVLSDRRDKTGGTLKGVARLEELSPSQIRRWIKQLPELRQQNEQRQSNSNNSMSSTVLRPVAAIIGAGPGNGAAFAKKFLAQGYSVAVCSRNAESMNQLADSIAAAAAAATGAAPSSSSTAMIRGYACNVSSETAITATFQSIQKDLGPISTVVYNAGSGAFKALSEWTADEITQMTDVNAAGLFRVANATLPHFQMHDDNSSASIPKNIVVIGASAALRGRPMTVGFAAAKAAQRSVAQSLAREWGAQKKIHVSYVVLDGILASERTKAWMPDKPDDFFMQSDDIAESVWSLVNQKQSSWTFELDLRPFGETW
jgi:NAD(P)-dependent dehydrogenase (short-subunit alcohol dehydrogenase family)